MIIDLPWPCVVQILEEFHNIFGPELKAVTGDPRRIDDVLRRVDSLIVPIEEVSFDPFNMSKMTSWKIIMQEFNTEVEVRLDNQKAEFLYIP